MAGQKSNVLGQHFTEPAPGQAKCNICSELVSMGSETGKTTNMWNHLKHHHLPVYKETRKEKEVAVLCNVSDSRRSCMHFYFSLTLRLKRSERPKGKVRTFRALRYSGKASEELRLP
ncbi:hypothetical protein MHYP_G00048520 [Metynnis hypsauchen]